MSRNNVSIAETTQFVMSSQGYSFCIVVLRGKYLVTTERGTTTAGLNLGPRSWQNTHIHNFIH